MATSDAVKMASFPANADLSASQYCFVSVNSSGKVAVTGDGLSADGILQNDPAAADREAAVAIGGRSKVKLGGTVAAGDDVGSDSTGRAVTAATGDVILGKCVEGGAVNNIGSIIFQPRGDAA